MPVYRYIKNSDEEVDVDSINNFIPDTVVSVSGGEPKKIIDIDAPSTSKDDLDEFMLAKGYGFVEASPTTESKSAAQLDLGVPNPDTREPNGFINTTDSQFSFVDLTRTFTIQPAVSEFSFYANGKKFTKTSAENIVIPDAEGVHFIYYDNDGVLQTTQTFVADIMTSFAFISAIYWSVSASAQLYFAEERHGIVMDGATHIHFHTTFGARFVSGLALGNLSVDGSGAVDASAQFSVNDGAIRDEDILVNIADDSPQDLSPISQIPIYYRTGAAGDWNIKAADNFPVIYTGSVPGYTGGRIAYNEFTGGAWQLTEIANNDFMLMHFFATNNIDNPVIGILGQVDYPNGATARAGALVEINNLLLGGLPFLEFVPIATVIFRTSNAYSNTPVAIVVNAGTSGDYVDWRGAIFSPGAGTSTDVPSHASSHQDGGLDEISVANLSGVLADPQNAGQLQSVNVSSAAPGNGQILTYNSTGSQWEPQPAGGTSTIFFTATDYNANFGSGYRTRSIAGSGGHRFSFMIPENFTSLIELSLVCVSAATVSGVDIDLISEYAAVGELINTNTESDLISTYNFTINEFTAIDISSVFTLLAAGDICGLSVDHNAIGATVHYLGIKLRYN